MDQVKATGRRVRASVLGLLLLALASSCGGPALPREPVRSSPLSPRAESAPAASLGASFEDRPLTEEERAPRDHSAHGAGSHGAPGGHATHGATDAGASDADAGAPHGDRPHRNHGSHPHAH